MNELIGNGKVYDVYALYINDPSTNDHYFSIQTIKDGEKVIIYKLYGKEVSPQQVLDFFNNNKPNQ